MVHPKDKDRENDEDLASEDDPNPSCLNKYQLLAEAEVNLDTSKLLEYFHQTSASACILFICQKRNTVV